MGLVGARFPVPGQALNLSTRFVLPHVNQGRSDAVALVVDDPQMGIHPFTYADVAAAPLRYGAMLSSHRIGLKARVRSVLEDGVAWEALP